MLEYNLESAEEHKVKVHYILGNAHGEEHTEGDTF